MPLIETIKDENLHLKHEKSQIEGEMASLHKLSQMILAENQQLRKHYSTRTSDIKKLIETISINTHEEISDVTHQSFLLRESNCAMVKKIELLMREMQGVAGENLTRRRMLDDFARKNVEVEQECRDVQVKNRQLMIKCEKVKA
jgi:hypothetical protein